MPMLTDKLLERVRRLPRTLYLKSRVWLAFRARVLERDGYRCVRCGCRGTRDNPLQVHEWRYPPRGEERLEDAVTLCRRCHKAHHAGQPGVSTVTIDQLGGGA